MPEQLTKDYPRLDNVAVDLRLAAHPLIFNPFAQNTSAPRANMLSKHMQQHVVLQDPDEPLIRTGMEYDLREYSFDKSRRDQDVFILDVIPKYPSIKVRTGTVQSPYLTVIYRGMDDGKIGYFTIERFVKCSDGFGYENVWHNITRAQKGMLLKKDVQLVTSPSHKGDTLAFGLNANVAYISHPDVAEDAIAISESFARRAVSTEISQTIITMRRDHRPIFTYGDEFDPQMFPDIGEAVRADGVIFASRPVSTQTCAADTDPESLRMVFAEQDEVYRAPAGAIITDIDIAVNKQRTTSPYHQIEKYQSSISKYWRRIVDAYQEHGKNNQLTDAFGRLAHTAMTRLLLLNEPVPGIMKMKTRPDIIGFNKQPVDFIQIVITYRLDRPAVNGMKLTDRHGCKGVVPVVMPDDWMPVDDFGIRADVMIAPDSPIGRMNLGTIYEPGINRISEFVRRRAAEEFKTDPSRAYNTILEWCGDVNRNYPPIIEECMEVPKDRVTWTQKVLKTGIPLWIPPFLESITMENYLNWESKWGASETPVTYKLRTRKGKIKTIRTKKTCSIGSKFFIVMCKYPYDTSAGISTVSQQGNPIKPGKDSKYKSSVRQVPVKVIGEDELRVIGMTVEAQELARLMCLCGNSPAAVEKMVEEFLTAPHPTVIPRIKISTASAMRTNTILTTFHHETSALGVDARNTITDHTIPENLFSEEIDMTELQAELGVKTPESEEEEEDSDTEPDPDPDDDGDDPDVSANDDEE